MLILSTQRLAYCHHFNVTAWTCAPATDNENQRMRHGVWLKLRVKRKIPHSHVMLIAKYARSVHAQCPMTTGFQRQMNLKEKADAESEQQDIYRWSRVHVVILSVHVVVNEVIPSLWLLCARDSDPSLALHYSNHDHIGRFNVPFCFHNLSILHRNFESFDSFLIFATLKSFNLFLIVATLESFNLFLIVSSFVSILAVLRFLVHGFRMRFCLTNFFTKFLHFRSAKCFRPHVGGI